MFPSLLTDALETSLRASSALPATDPALDTALAPAPATFRTAYAQLVTGDRALDVPLHVPSASMGLVPLGSRSRRLGSAMPDYDEDSISATPSSQSVLAELFFVTVVAQELMASSPLWCLGFVRS